jgi:4-amino-4-deoxy-L-arabinose transferase-like glycosyltransferase
MTSRQALWAVIAASTLLRLAWATSLGADTNEAYYYAYTQNPDWSYLDHPPMVAIVSSVGLHLVGGGPLVFGIRLGFIALFAGSTWLMARLTSRYFGPWAGVLAAFVLNVTGFYGLVVGTTSHPDGPLLFFWLLTLDRLAAALATPDRLRAWLWVGLAWGCALLSKYHAVFLPAGFACYLLVRPSARRCLRAPGPYVALLLGSLMFTPVVGWNAAHEWVSFRFQGMRAVGSFGIEPGRLASAILGQALFLFPWIWVPLVGILIRLLRRRPREWSEPEAFLLSQSAPVVALFLTVALVRGIMPHWPLIGFVALMPLLGRKWADLLAAHPKPQRRKLAAMACVPVVLAGLIVAQTRLGLLQDKHGRIFGLIAREDDPTIDLTGWDQVAKELNRRGLLDSAGTFVFTDSWRDSAQLAFATRMKAPVACYERDIRSFACWSRPEDWVGRDGILVHTDDSTDKVDTYSPYFDRIEPLGEFEVVRSGVPIRKVGLYRCVHQVKAFPFGYTTLATAHTALRSSATRR